MPVDVIDGVDGVDAVGGVGAVGGIGGVDGVDGAVPELVLLLLLPPPCDIVAGYRFAQVYLQRSMLSNTTTNRYVRRHSIVVSVYSIAGPSRNRASMRVESYSSVAFVRTATNTVHCFDGTTRVRSLVYKENTLSVSSVEMGVVDSSTPSHGDSAVGRDSLLPMPLCLSDEVVCP